MKTFHGLSALALVVLAAGSANASPRPVSPAEDGWLAFIGCWRAEGAPTNEVLCVVPEGNGVKMLTLTGSDVTSETRILADGVARPVEREGCRGTEQARWSADGQRLFLSSELSCGENVQRKVSGVMALRSSDEWMSVQAITAGGQTGTRTVVYTSVEPTNVPASVSQMLAGNRLARETARQAAGEPVELADVTEAVTQAGPAVVEAWLVAHDQPFDLDGRTLLQLADAGVPGSVIDVLVAVSNPDHFAVRDSEPRDEEDEERMRRRGYGGRSCYDNFYDSWDPYGYGYGYGYGRGIGRCGGFGYSPWGYYPYGGYYGRPVIVIRDPGRDNDSNGRATRRGYSKGNSDSGGSVSAPSTSTSGTKSSTGSSKAGSSGGTSTGRTAKPRGGN